MHHFRKSKAPADIPATASRSSAELVKKKDPRALATLSAGIALPIGSPSNDTRGTPSDDTTVQGMDAVLQTTYAAVRMAVEITKESSDLCPPLKAVVGAMSALMKNYDQTSDNAVNVKDIERRVQSLHGVLASPVGEDDYPENARRVELRRKLDGVIAKLEPLSEEHALLKFLRNVDNAKTLSGFVQELSDAITYYQVSLQQGVYEKAKNIHCETKNIHNETKNILEDAILEKLEPVCNAGYQTGHHDKCLPGTRESVLSDLMLWAKNPQNQSVFWLNGLAGTGKSTIAQSFSEEISKEGLLGASFFCSRDYLDRKELKHIFPTLAYQLACHYPHFQNHIISIIQDNPTIAHTSLITQLEELLVNPLSRTNISCVIVIDALDECIDNEPSSAILSVLGQFINQLPLVKFFITGRPEPRIRTGFRLPLLQPITQIFLLHGVDSTSVNKDIQLYLTERLAKISKQRSNLDLPNPWPHDGEIEALTEKSSGLFIFASTMVRFIESEHHDPNKRLQLLLSEANSTMLEGRTGIDSLYSQILQYAFSKAHEPGEFADIRHVLGAIVLAFNPLSRRELSAILGISMPLISTTLRHLHSVILVPGDESEKIRIFHKSFPDFLQDDKRCIDTRLHINPGTYHGEMALSCLELVKDLKRNPCSLPPFIMNQDIQDLTQLLEEKIGGAVQYACTYWTGHLGLSPTSEDFAGQIINLALSTLQNAPPWIEVMSLQNQLGEVIHSMNSLLDWLNKINLPPPPRPSTLSASVCTTPNNQITTLHDLATDCLRLSMQFFHPIQQCAQQIYHTALPLSPTSSHLQRSCLQSVADDHLSHVIAFIGAPSTWGLLLRTIDVRPRELTCITTSGQGIIAACGDIVNIYDAVTGILQQSLSPSEVVRKIQASPHGSTLFFAHSSSVTMWDVQTGGLIHTFTTQSEVNDIAVSTSGHHIACGSSNGFVEVWNIRTKQQGSVFRNDQPVVAIHWLSTAEFAVATQSSVCIYEIATRVTSNTISIPGRVWGMVCLQDDKFLVGTLQATGVDRGPCSLKIISRRRPSAVYERQSSMRLGQLVREERESPMYTGQLMRPTIVGKEIACITPPNGVQSFGIESHNWTNNPPLLGAATSVAVSLNRNLVVQTKDSIQIFSVDVLTSREVRNDVRPPHVYPLGKKYIICVAQPHRRITLLELETLRELRPDDDTLPFGSFLLNQTPSARASFCPGLVARFDIPAVMRAWQSGTPLPRSIEVADGDKLRQLYGLSPAGTEIAIVMVSRGSLLQELWVNGAKRGDILAHIRLEDEDLGSGEVYEITFDSETRLYLKIDKPGQHVQIPYDITATPSGELSHTITRGEPMPLPEPRATPPYTLDTNCEWVLDAQSRKICWISPGNVLREDGGHFWVGSSLVMAGDDGVVRKISFKEPGY